MRLSWLDFYEIQRGIALNFSALSPDIAKFVDTLKAAFSDRMDEHSGSNSQSNLSQAAVRRALLSLLLTRAYSADALITEITTVSAGTWVPTEGTIHPELQLMTEEGLVGFELVESRKTYFITDVGRTWIKDNPANANSYGDHAKTEGRGWNEHLSAKTDLAKAGATLGRAVAALAASGSKADLDQATRVLKESAKSLFTILGRAE